MLREVRKETEGLADLLRWAAVIEDGIVMQWDGSLMAVWKYRGPDLASATHAEMNAVAARLNNILRLGSGWMVQVDAFRFHADDYAPPGFFGNPVTALIDEERRAQFSSKSHFESEYFFTLTYLPPLAAEEKATGFFISGPKVRRQHAAEALEYFKIRVKQFGDVFGSQFPIRRLKGVVFQETGGFARVEDEFLGFLRRTLCGEESPVLLPDVPIGLNDMLACDDFLAGMNPMLGRRHLRIISVDGFPSMTWPGSLGILDTIPYAYRWNTRAILLDAAEAQHVIDKARKQWNFQKRGLKEQLTRAQHGATNLHAVSMAADAEAAMAEAASGDVQYAYFSSTVILMDEDERQLERMVGEVRKALVNRGFGARVEGVNAVEAWLGSLPGNGYENLRRVLAHTRNLVDLMPVTAVWSGERTCPSSLMPPDSPPLMYAATGGGTPFRVNLHYQDVGHSLMLGPTGAGKSTAIALAVAQFFRYPNAQVFAFDKGHSLYALARGAGGQFYDIGKTGISFQPLRHIDQPGEFAWACEWIESLVRMQQVAVRPSEKRLIQEAMQLSLEAPIGRRTLTEFQAQLQSRELKDALNPYCISGSLGALLDADTDALADSSFIVCEMEYLLGGNFPSDAVMAVLSYLFRRMERRLDGRPTLVPIDEAWLFLKHPVWRDRIQDWLKTLRKKNAAVLLATQNLSDVCESEIASTILQACYTKIYLPNAEAANENAKRFYTNAGLNSREIEIVQRAIPKREYYITQPLGRRLVSFGLGPIALSFVGAASPQDRARVDYYVGQYGKHWVPFWLRERGVSKEWVQVFEREAAKCTGDAENSCELPGAVAVAAS